MPQTFNHLPQLRSAICLWFKKPKGRASRKGYAFLILGAFCFASLETRAWNYQEHFAITYTSLKNACALHSSSTQAEADQLCTEEGLVCLAHMAALAGDYIKSPRALIEDVRTRKVLNRGVIDCSTFLSTSVQALNFASGSAFRPVVEKAIGDETVLKKYTALPQCMAPDGWTWTPQIEFKLIKNPFRRGYRWITLATRNAQHFQPASYDSWLYYSSKANDGSIARNMRLAYQAFALHFLEDSFPAGHIGLDRPFDSSVDPEMKLIPLPHDQSSDSYLLGRSQDYAHAYHDDMNHAGHALRTAHPATSEPDWWFGYGDTQLCAPTIYLYVPPRDSSSPDLVPSLLTEVFKAVHAVPFNAHQDGTFQKYAIKAINDTPARSSKKPPVVLSLSRGGGFLQTSINSAISSDFYQFFHQFSTCAWSQYCDKIEVVLTSNLARKNDAHCQSTTPDPNAPDFLLLTCDESAEHIRLAASAAQAAFLYTFALRGANTLADESAASSLALATAEIPREYSSNNPKNAIGSTSLNLENKVLFYDDFESVDHVKPHVYEGWGPSFTRFNGRGLGESMLAFGPSLGMAGCTACNIDLRVGILDWHESAVSAPLDSVFTSFIYHPFPPKLGRAVTGNFRVDAGFQGLWDGPQRRNVFVGGGFGIELQFGRYVIEMVGTRDYHWNSQLHFTPTTTLSIGVRIPSISLSRSPT